MRRHSTVCCARWAASILAGALAAFAGGCGGAGDGDANAAGEGPLLVLVGGTMRPVMERLASEYTEKTGKEVDIDSAGSGELLIRIETQEKGDLYVCHDPFQRMLMRKGLGVEGWTLAVVTPTIVVAEGNPKGIKGVPDLAGDGLKLAMTHPTHSTTGWIIPTIFEKAGKREEIEANIVKRTRGGGSAANLVAIGDVDAAIVWNAVAHLREDKLDAVPIAAEHEPIPGVDAVTSATDRSYDIGRIKVTMALLECSRQKPAARDFAEFVLKHQGLFTEEFGFSPAPTAATAPSGAAGQVMLHCGAGIRHAMEDAIQAFEAATGATVEASYQGSGTLITTIKLKQRGDLYMPGDVWYLDQLAEDGSVIDRAMVAYFVPVIIVQKGNPKGIRSLADLVKPGTELGVGNPAACQIGRLTAKLFARNDIAEDAVEKVTAYSSVTVNELGVKVQTESIDAAIVWDAVAANFAKDVEIVPIPLEKNLISRVAIGLLKYSENKPLARRFMSFLQGEGRAIFAAHDYTVEDPTKP